MHGMKSVIALALLTAGALQPLPILAAEWPHWRGPNFDGSSPETNTPVQFSKTQGVRWVAPLPGPSAATPVVWNNRVFVSSTDTRTKTLRAICLDAQTGRELWNQEIAPGFQLDERSNLASPSPLTDGRRVWFYYGTGDLVAFDFSGKKLWARNIQNDHGPFAFLWTYAASPTLFEGRLYIQVLQRDVPVQGRGRTDGPNDSYLLALDPQTGKDLWRHVRPSDAVAESREAYSTPIPCRYEGRAQLLVTGGDCITSHDPQDGTELWRWGTWNPTRITHWRLVPSPVAGAGIALACGPKGAPVYAVKLASRGTLDDSALAWVSRQREISSDVCTPLFFQGRFFVLNGDRKTIARLDPATGKPDWIGELGTRDKIEASPVGADGKIYFQDFRGRVFVVSAGEEFKILHVAELGEADENQIRSSIAVAGGRLFIRTNNKLWCIGS